MTDALCDITILQSADVSLHVGDLHMFVQET